MFTKILIANRGEIAVRVIHACRELGVKTAAVFSEPDRAGRHVEQSDEAWLLEGQPGRVYLDAEQIVRIARRAGADAIHPGYGFLAENAEFAELCTASGITFIGPRPDVIRSMGSKVESRRMMEAAGVPVVPGTTDPVADLEALKRLASGYGYPIAVKASAGGGGRGLRVARCQEDLEQALAGAQREGASYFGSSEVYLEKYLERPRHVEVQILADNHGNVVHVGERDCSTQRRHQKLVEESPAPSMPGDLRQRLLDAAVLGAKSIGYTSAGTVECLVAGNQFYFLEMNTRVQVEHPVTEMVTGIDIVKEQILLSAGRRLSFNQSDVLFRGHAIECRINAEDPFRQFMPSPGTVCRYIEPSGPWVRVDSACYSGYQVLPFYDSLLAKLIVWGRTRQEAIDRLRSALRSFVIEGVATTIPFHLLLLDDESFLNGTLHTGYVESQLRARLNAAPALSSATVGCGRNGDSSAGGEPADYTERNFEVEVNQKQFKVKVRERKRPDSAALSGEPGRTAATVRPRAAGRPLRPGRGEVRAQMHGLVKQVLVKPGEAVKLGQRLIIFEAMKMESDILADRDGLVEKLAVKSGDTVEASEVLLVIGAGGS